MRISDWSSDVCSSDLVVGRDDGIGDQLLAKAASYGIPSNVRFLGSREDVPSLVAGSDIGVLCSHEEGFSNRSAERRVGQACVSQCRTGWSQASSKKIRT